LDVVRRIGPECTGIFIVDDHCPEESGALVEREVSDRRVRVIRHASNTGVGGAMVTGYRAALKEKFDIVVKVDGDGQMDPSLIPSFIDPLLSGEADYVKGNRFFSLYFVRRMPRIRLFGNAVLSFVTKLSSGYWQVFDPTNGFTAVHRSALERLDLSKIDQRFFFESDMLIQLGDIRAVVMDIPMEAVYGEEESNLQIRSVTGRFLMKHAKNTIRRVVYSYFFRDFSLASINLVVGTLLIVFGIGFGAIEWSRSVSSGIPATTGTVMISVLPIILGFQLLLFFLGYDISGGPTRPLQTMDRARRPEGDSEGNRGATD